jgi:hypothetical protein
LLDGSGAHWLLLFVGDLVKRQTELASVWAMICPWLADTFV